MPGALMAVISVNCHEAAGHAPDNERHSRDFHANAITAAPRFAEGIMSSVTFQPVRSLILPVRMTC